MNIEEITIDSTICIKWSVGDVLEAAKEDEEELTIKEAWEVLQNVKKFHDSNDGITWEVIKGHIRNYQRNKQ